MPEKSLLVPVTDSRPKLPAFLSFKNEILVSSFFFVVGWGFLVLFFKNKP